MGAKRYYIETYGCQMNVADSELVNAILAERGYERVENAEDADAILMNTCSVRENAETRIYGRIGAFKPRRRDAGAVVGVLGCMAERLRDELVERHDVDVVVGPDEYRRLPDYLEAAFRGEKAVGVKLSRTETYEDLAPLRENGVSAWIPIARGCDRFCSYCVVPYTRGRERSRSFSSIVAEAKELARSGYREITLLGQNVNAYAEGGADFADLLAACADVAPPLRARFATSHPSDLSERILQTIAERRNVCAYLHLPVQSGSNRVLELMNRGYTIERYLDIVDRARELSPDIAITTDVIAGFPTETEEDHRATLEVFRRVRYDGAYMFRYSPRPRSKAATMADDVPEETKKRRLQEIIDLQRTLSEENNRAWIGAERAVLVEGASKKSDERLSGRTDDNKLVVFPKPSNVAAGDYVLLRITDATSATLFGEGARKIEAEAAFREDGSAKRRAI